MSEGTTLYCGDNCNHTGPHRYPPASSPAPAGLAYREVRTDGCAGAYDAGWNAALDALASSPAPAGLDVERLGFYDLLSIGEALLEHYPPHTIVCTHNPDADIGARTAAAIGDLIASCRAATRPAEEPTRFCGSCRTPGHFAGDGRHPCLPTRPAEDSE